MHPWIPILLAFQLGAVPRTGASAPEAAQLPMPSSPWTVSPRPPRMVPMRPPVPVPTPPRLPSAAGDTTVPYADEWFAEDKLRHFFLSFAVTNLGYGAARTAGLDHGLAEIVAVAGAAAAGLWKEFHDRSIGKPFSRKDLVWDGLGILAGLVLATQTR